MAWRDSLCELAVGSRNAGGYVQMWVRERQRQMLAHRWAWEQAYGPIPAGLYVCHHCDVPECINPQHLFLGTPRDNTLDAKAKGRLKNFVPPPQQFCKYGHSDWVKYRNCPRLCRPCLRRRERESYARHRSKAARAARMA